MTTTPRPFTCLSALTAALVAAGLLTACGGGGGGGSTSRSDSSSGGSGGSAVTLTGVVARGAAVAGATVTAQCATGGGTATTLADGSYSLSMANAALPCVVQASKSGESDLPLHTVATTTVANITTLTQLVVAQLTGQLPASYFGSLDRSTLATTVTATKVANAQTAVKAVLTSAGVSGAASLGDLITGTLLAANGSTSGNAYDQTLDALAATLASTGSTLAQLTQTVADTSAATPSSSGGSGTSSGSSASTSSDSSSTVSSLPADLLLKPKASNCDALRSTTYRVIKFAPSNDTGNTAEVSAIERVSLDATTLRFTNAANTADSWTMTANGSCRYTDDAGLDEIVVAPSGIIVGKVYVGSDDDSVNASARGSWRMLVAIPEQTHTLDELAGTWNYLNWQPSEADDTVWTVEAASFTMNNAGVWTGFSCNSTISATPSNPSCGGDGSVAVTVHSAGGFRINTRWDNADHYSRLFLYRTGTGALVGIDITPGGQPTFMTPQASVTLPAVGDSWSVRNIALNSSLLATDALQLHTHTVTAVSSTDTSYGGTGRYVRNTATTGSSTTTPQTLYANSGGTGYVYRPQASTTDSTGAAATVRKQYALPLAGTGLTAYWLDNTATTGNNARFGLSVR